MTQLSARTPIQIEKKTLLQSGTPDYIQIKLKQQENNRNAINKLYCVVALTSVFVAVELVGGIYADSVAIISDAAHLVSDVLGVSISIIALKIAENDANV